MITCISELPYSVPLSQAIVVNESPTGIQNNSNNTFTTEYPFSEGTLEIYIDGVKVDRSAYIANGDNTGWEFVIDPTDPKKLNAPISDIETLTVNYLREIGQDGFLTL